MGSEEVTLDQMCEARYVEKVTITGEAAELAARN
jgi:hypothetical protein